MNDYSDIRLQVNNQISDLSKKLDATDEEFLELRKEIDSLEEKYKEAFDKHFTFKTTLRAIHRLTTEYATISENVKDLLTIANTLADENAVARVITTAMDALFKKKDIINDIIGHLNTLQKLYNDIYKVELKFKEDDSLDNIEGIAEGLTDFGNIE